MSDSEDEDGDNRRDQANFKQISNKRKASSEAVNGTTVTKLTESTVIIPSKTEETTENGSTNEIPSETVITTTTTTTEEVTKTTTVGGEDDAVGASTNESAPVEAITDGMDTSE